MSIRTPIRTRCIRMLPMLALVVPLLLGHTFDPVMGPLPQPVAETPMELLDRNLAAGAQPKPGEVLVVARAGVSAEMIEHLAASLRCSVHGQMGNRPFFVVQCNPAVPIQALLEQWWSAPEVGWTEASYAESSEATPDDLDQEQWHHHNEGQTIDEVDGVAGADINSLAAWQLHTGSSEVVIAPIDNGLFYAHEDLEQRIWNNPREICGNGEDDGQNGYVDDCWGWDIAEGHNDPSPLRLPDERPDGKRCSRWHGTMIGGLAAATGDNEVGLAGVGWNLTLMNLKRTHDQSCKSFTSGSMEAAAYAIDNGAHVLVMSFNSSAYSPMFASILHDGDEQGVISVMSGGNGSADSDELTRYPNNYDIQNKLVVANTTNRDELSSRSNWGAENIDLAAPGNDLFGPGIEAVDDYRTGSGTSYAAPLVAGTAGLVLSAFPHMHAESVVDSIRRGVHPLPNLDCEETAQCVSSGGRLDVHGALRQAASRAGPPRIVYRGHTITEASGAEGDGRIEPGEVVEIYLEVGNQGGDAQSVSARLRASSDGTRDVVLGEEEVSFGSVLGGIDRVSAGAPLSLEVHADCAGVVDHVVEIQVRDEFGYGFDHRLDMRLDCDIDADQDGWLRPDDCDDAAAQVHPDAEEVCDGRDTNCDGTVDEDAVDRTRWWLDADNDGYGKPGESVLACEQRAGYLDNPYDCDDTDPNAYPGAPKWSENCERIEADDGGCSTGAAPAAAPWFVLLVFGIAACWRRAGVSTGSER